MEDWKARYAIQPWDGASRYGLAKLQYEPPAEVDEIMEKWKRREARRQRRQGVRPGMTNAEINRKLRKAYGKK